MKANKERREFPKLVNQLREDALNRNADLIVRDYERIVFPLLFRLGMFDDEHIRKYLACSSMEDIYRDFERENGTLLHFMEEEAKLNGTDIWKAIRDRRSPVDSPKEEGFIFAPLPHSDMSEKPLILKAISVQNHKFSIDRGFYQENCIIKPTEKQIELYNLLSDFCEAFQAGKYGKDLQTLLTFDYNTGKMSPSLCSILGVKYIRKL